MGGVTPLRDSGPVLTHSSGPPALLSGPEAVVGRAVVGPAVGGPAVGGPAVVGPAVGGPAVGVDPAWPSSATVVPIRPRRTQRGRHPMRGRHVRERGHLRVPVPFAVAHVDNPEDRIVLQALRRQAVVDLDVAQIGVAAGLAPSMTAPALDRLVRAGLVAGTVVGGRQRFGLP